jgi:hypothetical protein
MGQFRLVEEFKKILTSDLFNDVKLLYVERDEDIKITKREKDYFGNFESADHEKELFERIFSEFNHQITDIERNNEFGRMINEFDDVSSIQFNRMLNDLINRG